MKQLTQRINNSSKYRFAVAGAASTLIDFGIYFIVTSFFLSPLAANYISTSIAFCFSFVTNKHYTFKTVGTSLKREITLFIIVTLVGLWVIQPAVISVILNSLATQGIKDVWYVPVGAKIVATIFSLTWNYILYSRIVFAYPDKTNSKEVNK